MALPKPEWMKIRSQINQNNIMVEDMLKSKCLHTVCGEANCPNINECFAKKTVTFMILGSVCTRNCTFCTVQKGDAMPVSENEPQMVAQAVLELNLKHVVITSVTRDDLADGGAGHFAKVIKSVRAANDKVTIEVLIPDFQGDIDALKKVVDANPDIINHNIETVPRLYPEVRPMAIFERSIELLGNVKKMNKTIHIKSGMMLGLGEREEEVIEAMERLRSVDCNLLTIGQYLAPSKLHHPVIEYIHPDIFEKYLKLALNMNFDYVASAPFVRSSYHAGEAFEVVNTK
jgi:lipoic acid synthetase